MFKYQRAVSLCWSGIFTPFVGLPKNPSDCPLSLLITFPGWQIIDRRIILLQIGCISQFCCISIWNVPHNVMLVIHTHTHIHLPYLLLNQSIQFHETRKEPNSFAGCHQSIPRSSLHWFLTWQPSEFQGGSHTIVGS
jgi:hypothetical protein